MECSKQVMGSKDLVNQELQGLESFVCVCVFLTLLGSVTEVALVYFE